LKRLEVGKSAECRKHRKRQIEGGALLVEVECQILKTLERMLDARKEIGERGIGVFTRREVQVQRAQRRERSSQQQLQSFE
jgi:hypothetical protein